MKIERIPIEAFRTLKMAAFLSTDEFAARCKTFCPDYDAAELRRLGKLAEHLSPETYEQLRAIGVETLEIKLEE